MDIQFIPLQLKDSSMAFEFLMDSFKVSFGEDSSLWPNNLGQMKEEKYSEIIRKKLASDPESVIHVWQNKKIIGQIELSLKKDDSSCGYVSLYYLISEKRGLGFGKSLDQYAIEKLKSRGCRRAELSVDQTNTPAILFYKKHGWIEKGAHPFYKGGIIMEKIFG